MSAGRDPFQVDEVTVFKPTARAGHGIGLRLFGYKDEKFTLRPGCDSLFLDVHGNFWGALPPGASSIANWILPYQVANYSVQMPTRGPKSYRGEISFSLAEDKLSHPTLLNIIQKMVDGGNPPILVELWYQSQGQPRKHLAQGVVQPSVLLREFNNTPSGNVLSYICADLVPRRTNPLRTALRTLRWMVFPVLFMMICWSMLFYTPHETPFSPYAPSILRRAMNTNFTVDYRSVVPVHPTKMTQAYEVGRIAGALEYADPSLIPELLRKAALAMGVDSISVEQLAAVPSVLHDVEQSQGLVTRILGFFSLINMVWLLAILGITVSVGPAVFILVRPISRLFIEVARVVVVHIIIPTVRFLHEWGFFEMGVWFATIGLFLESMEIRSPTIGFFITLSALAMTGPSLWLSTFLYGQEAVKRLSRENRGHLINAYIALVTVPLAVYYESLLLSFAATIAIYGILGFSVACYGLCYCIGFDNRDAMIRVAATSWLLLSICTTIKIVWGNPWWLEAFRMPVSIIGSLTLYLACLIYSSHYYQPYPYTKWLRRQAPMIICLILGQLAGQTVLNQTGLANTATVFLVLYLVEKASDLHHYNGWNGWILIFFLSCVSYYGALRLHSSPEIITRMLDF